MRITPAGNPATLHRSNAIHDLTAREPQVRRTVDSGVRGDAYSLLLATLAVLDLQVNAARMRGALQQSTKASTRLQVASGRTVTWEQLCGWGPV